MLKQVVPNVFLGFTSGSQRDIGDTMVKVKLSLCFVDHESDMKSPGIDPESPP
jgi:hypothetical protein